MWTCARCGTTNEPAAQSCVRCGAPPPAGPAPLASYDVAQPGGYPAFDPPVSYEGPTHPQYGDQQYGDQQYGDQQYGDQRYAGQQYPPAPAPVQRRRWWVPVLIAAVLLLAAGAVTTVLVVESRRGTGDGTAQPGPAGQSAGRTAGPTTAAPSGDDASPPPPLPTAVGVVAIDRSVTDRRARDVAAMFDTYFAAVNSGDPEPALALYDPAGAIDPGDPAEADAIRRGISTSSDSQIVLAAITPGTKGVLDARMTFRSNQAAGHGPAGRTSETCTMWDVTYSLTQPDGIYYRIFAGSAKSAPC